MSYIGRFAPSPSGPLHLGSMVAAIGSYLDAKHHGGQWLVRMEDIDPPREQPGADKLILETLEHFELEWDGAVEYQSKQYDHFQMVLDELIQSGRVYPCQCTRKLIKAEGGHNRTECLSKGTTTDKPSALRFRNEKPVTQFNDRFQGLIEVPLQAASEDVILKRKDGLFAYMLAVVLDDHRQEISHIVRGLDLLDTSVLQIALYQALNLKLPDFAHLPLVTNPVGDKLSKQNHAKAVEAGSRREVLLQVLKWLGQNPSAEQTSLSYPELLTWAIENWQPERLRGIEQVISNQ